MSWSYDKSQQTPILATLENTVDSYLSSQSTQSTIS